MNPAPIMHPMTQLERLMHAIERLTLAYRRRKATGRPYGHLMARCARLSGAWLLERHKHLMSGPP